ncbi:ribokinase [Paenibacillus mendelii]|uniref:Ribokinase n=1 Tax=Paenibacillus mendelii TaxID=206163 RepID=A0ABV6J337_9BACL|nr:ribokinase [Paenibacillus mendelii]MCQ6559407.1 ribokinase [Paenibacillus mendelii]
MKPNRVLVVGSYVVDLMSRTPHMPRTGETVLGGPFRMGAGGKGGNQAAAAARLGAKVSLVTKVGDDEFGRSAMSHFQAEGIRTDWVTVDPEEATGVALILVDDNKDNQIVVSLGACGTLSREDVEKVEADLAASDIVLIQLETNLDAVGTALNLADKHHIPSILNPAPYQPFDRTWLKYAAYITPNETEASALTEMEVNDPDSAASAARLLADWGARSVLITLGGKGVVLRESTGQCWHIPPYQVEVKDTTGAGDAFNGGFAHALSVGKSALEAALYASAVAALSVTRVGTAVSMPQESEVLELMEDQRNHVKPIAFVEGS